MEELELSEAAEELLATIWAAQEEEARPDQHRERPDAPAEAEAVQQLLDAGLIEQQSGRHSLTAAGKRWGASIIRRERLAERLLADVLNVGNSLASETACKFEHLLQKGLDDEICTLLGHPRVCPHGAPIPPGECCRTGARAASKVVSSLADLHPGEGGLIAYIHARQRPMLRRLLAMGVVPGAPISLLQNHPSFVFELGHTQIAVDRETAQDVYVRVGGRAGPWSAPAPRSWMMRPFSGLRLRRGRRRR